VSFRGRQPGSACRVNRVYELREFFEWRGLGSIDHSASGCVRPMRVRCGAQFSVPAIRIADPKSASAASPEGCHQALGVQSLRKACTPEKPLGALMVSSEGACAAYYQFGAIRVKTRDERSMTALPNTMHFAAPSAAAPSACQRHLAHGGGGWRCAISSMMCSSPSLTIRPGALEDQARFSLAELSRLGDRLASPPIPMSSIRCFSQRRHRQARVCGTINDLAVGGAIPLYLTCSAIIEEGLEVDTLRALAKSMALAAADAVFPSSRATQVVHKGTCDKLSSYGGDRDYPEGVNLGADRCGW